MKNMFVLGILVTLYAYTMDQHPEITFHRNGSLTIGNTLYKSPKELVETNPASAVYTIETLKESNYQLSHRVSKLEQNIKKYSETFDECKQLKQKLLQTHQTSMQDLKDTLEQTEMAKNKFDEATARTIHYNQWVIPLYHNLNIVAYMALGYGILTLHNQACSQPSHTYMHEFICNPL